ncbi:MAG: membrane protein insertase YidC [Micromonosporaceae bacterium]
MFGLFDVSRLLEVPLAIAYHAVNALAAWFAPLPGGMATAAAIIVFTVAVRLLLLPLSYYAIRGERARARFLPRFLELQRRYATQPELLQRELSKLRQAEGAGMFTGCLPFVLQIPFFSLMYRLFLSRSVAGAPNALLTHRLAGVQLASRLLTGAGPFGYQGLVFLGLFALLTVVAWFAVRLARGAYEPTSLTGSGGATGRLARLLPYGTVAVAAVVPLAAGIYLLTTTAWTVLERWVLRHLKLPASRRSPSPISSSRIAP